MCTNVAKLFTVLRAIKLRVPVLRAMNLYSHKFNKFGNFSLSVSCSETTQALYDIKLLEVVSCNVTTHTSVTCNVTVYTIYTSVTCNEMTCTCVTFMETNRRVLTSGNKTTPRVFSAMKLLERLVN